MKRITFICLVLTLATFINESAAQNPIPPVPPPPPEEAIFKVVEEMPRFPGCENSNQSSKSKENCAKEAMLEYIYETLEYPEIAKANGVEGMAVIQFKVWKDSTIRDIIIVRDPGAGTGEAAKKVVESMNKLIPKWRPGHQRGMPVCVQYTLPVKFKLDDTEKPSSKNRNGYNDLKYIYELHEDPVFPECKREKSSTCTKEKLKEFIIANQIYPEEALKNGTEGTVVMTFVIERDGTLSQIRPEINIPDGISKDAIEIFKWMNSEEMTWVPGRINYKPVRTYYRVNVRYYIDEWNSRN